LDGKQNSMLHNDWTVSSLPLRDVASAETTDISCFWVKKDLFVAVKQRQ
jgi:hypothetical protein